MDWHSRYLQQAGWTHDLRSYLFARARLDNATRILDVGCGTGAVLLGMPDPDRFFGLDLDFSRVIETRAHVPDVHCLCGNAHQIPFPQDTFDITFCHLLLLWVSDPLQTLIEMKRVTRSGGALLVLAEPDYDHRLDEPEALTLLGQWQKEALLRQGANPVVGRRLEEFFTQAGIHLIETGSLREDKPMILNPAQRQLEWEVLDSDLAGYISKEELQRIKQLDEQAWIDGTRRLFVPMYFAYGLV